MVEPLCLAGIFDSTYIDVLYINPTVSLIRKAKEMSNRTFQNNGCSVSMSDFQRTMRLESLSCLDTRLSPVCTFELLTNLHPLRSMKHQHFISDYLSKFCINELNTSSCSLSKTLWCLCFPYILRNKTKPLQKQERAPQHHISFGQVYLRCHLCNIMIAILHITFMFFNSEDHS